MGKEWKLILIVVVVAYVMLYLNNKSMLPGPA
jgi:hypothetical protein